MHMPIPSSRLRRPVGATLVALAATTALAAPATSAQADQPRPDDRATAAARAAGITTPGQAYLGWAQDRTASAPRAGATRAAASVNGIDVSAWQGNVDWPAQWAAGNRFAYVKATEGTGYTSPNFTQQYTGSADVGMKRGSYHFARPDVSDGAAQADYFVDHGGGWSGDGRTLPGVLDIEWNPYGDTCYGKSANDMVTWVGQFTARYKERTGRDAVIYTAQSWWNQCTGSSTAFGATNPLWVARYAAAVGDLPAGWGFHTIWQYTDTPIDQNSFNGDEARLQALADG